MTRITSTVAITVATIIACAAAAAAAAQPAPQSDCATQLTPETARKILQFQAAGKYRLTAEQRQVIADRGVMEVPMTVHVVRRSNGTGGIAQSQIDAGIADANALWAPVNIQFCQYGPTRFIDSDFYFNLPPASRNQLLQVDRVENTINIYLVNDFGPWCGAASFPGDIFQGIVMVNSCVGTSWNPSTFGHELGHYFDLYHTHETFFGDECVDGSNCSTAGDLLCDTPADPKLSGLVNSSCNYTGSATDDCNNDTYMPDPSNIMSYSTKTCRTFFSPDQRARAQATLMNLRPELLDVACTLSDPCGSAGAGDCLADNGTPGCSDGDCCALVCAIDPFCCDNNWDNICAGEAIDMCGLAGDECSNAIEINEGTVTPDLSNNTAATGDDTSCGIGDELDEWYAYTASCNGTATASICTEFTVVDITLGIFEACEGPEIACSTDHSDCFNGNDSNAEVSWPVTAGQTYLVRVSGEGATQKSNFTGDMTISCDGCGNPDSGSCLAVNGSPYCADPACCEAVCMIDSFCCDNTWDSVCVDEAATICDSCGGAGTGSCFVDNGTPFCDRSSCCSAVCTLDPFCCTTAWDSLCASQAAGLEGDCVFVPPSDVTHVPLGSATLTGLPDGVMIDNIDGVGDPDGMRLDLPGAPADNAAVFEFVVPDMLPAAPLIEVGVIGELEGPSPCLNPRLSFGAVGVRVGLALLADLNNGPQQYRILALNGDTVVADLREQTVQQFAFSGDAPLPSVLGGERRGSEHAVYMQWDNPATFTIGNNPDVTADTIVLSTHNADGPDGPGGAGQPRGAAPQPPIEAVFLQASGEFGSISVGRERFDVPGPQCRADLDFSGSVDVFDLFILLNNWGACDACPADIVENDEVDVFDLFELLNAWGACP